MRQGVRKTGVSKEIGAAGTAGTFAASLGNVSSRPLRGASKDEVVGVYFLRAILPWRQSPGRASPERSASRAVDLRKNNNDRPPTKLSIFLNQARRAWGRVRRPLGNAERSHRPNFVTGF